jgi:hypothetical protein
LSLAVVAPFAQRTTNTMGRGHRGTRRATNEGNNSG